MIKLSIGSAIFIAAAIVITVLIHSCQSASAPLNLSSPQGVTFSGVSYNNIIEESKKVNKPAFIFIHANYCTACKKMAGNVLPAKNVGDLYNNLFINGEFDIESAEGKYLVNKYDITSTPTLLYISPDGRVILKESGFHSIEELTALAAGISN